MNQLTSELFNVVMRFKKNCKFRHNHDLSANEILVIKHIKEKQPISSKDICANFHFSKSFFSSILTDLEKKKIVTKQISPVDKRIILLSLTKQAADLIANHKSVITLRFEWLIKQLGEKDARELVRLLKKVNTLVEESGNENIS